MLRDISPYTEIVIYFFTGTGNAKNVAYWVLQVAEEYKLPITIIDIAKTNRSSVVVPPQGALIIFVSPIHGFNYPPIMIHFIARFPKGKNDVILMNTRAGMLIGKFIVPGITGIAFYLSSLFLMFKGFSIKGLIPVDLPSNWISIHPGLNKRTVKYLHEKNKERVIGYSRKILCGDSVFKSKREIIQDLVCSPISLLYYLCGRFVFAKTYYASSDCNNCGICIRNCPVKAIVSLDNRPYWTFKCESCMNCMSTCPRKAIETAHGFIIGLIVFNSTVLMRLLYQYFNQYLFELKNDGLSFLIESGFFLGLLAISYRLVHYALRFKPFEWLMVYTSLTKYKFWGRRYRALKEEPDNSSQKKLNR